MKGEKYEKYQGTGPKVFGPVFALPWSDRESGPVFSWRFPLTSIRSLGSGKVAQRWGVAKSQGSPFKLPFAPPAASPTQRFLV